ncbi:Hypothetical predicted protein [Olea europaea subsp. europaea]|uniref:Uncharacterized protein n=1 Tax=Olea europaea subsp. europaea TaxID=158383 RepID=A0A8S0T073_OLEEU|nr:Hypothetical predicted protein [Olea europaea subsp. europaea]
MGICSSWNMQALTVFREKLDPLINKQPEASLGHKSTNGKPKPDVKLGDSQNCEVLENKEKSISAPVAESGKERTVSPIMDGDTFTIKLAEFPPWIACRAAPVCRGA